MRAGLGGEFLIQCPTRYPFFTCSHITSSSAFRLDTQTGAVDVEVTIPTFSRECRRFHSK